MRMKWWKELIFWTITVIVFSGLILLAWHGKPAPNGFVFMPS